MKSLPVKSLVQFRCVSKPWKSLIDSSEFITAHSLRSHTQKQHLLVLYDDPRLEENFVCYVDDDTFPQQRSLPTPPPSFRKLIHPQVVGSSHGLLCLFCDETNMVVLWNPSIRKSIVVDVPKQPIISFGVCPVTNDPKIVAITKSQDTNHCGVMVYTVSSGKWKSLSSNLPNFPILGAWFPVVIDRFIYLIDALTQIMIISIDVSNESFEVLDLPDSLARHDLGGLYISKLRESLAILQNKGNMCSVWMMEHGDQKSFTKLFTIETPHDFIMGFRNNSVPIMLVGRDEDDDDDVESKLVVYDPNSKQNNVLETSRSSYLFSVSSYMETLILLGRSYCTSF